MAATAALKILPRPIESHLISPTERWRHLIGNILVASGFFMAALPNARNFARGPADAIWTIGAILMGVLSLVRIPPRAAMLDSRAFASSIAVFLLPCLMRAHRPSVGLIASAGIAFEIGGVAMSQVARLYMGRSFGILPGNRGIVSKGPFRIIRHPIYAGWFFLTLGYLFSFPSWGNFMIIIATLPFMMWRIMLEEELLGDDPEYREYQRLVPSRLVPGIF
jgi:protein-S-isoprenylcysteine O-methyltransferase Ste14